MHGAGTTGGGSRAGSRARWLVAGVAVLVAVALVAAYLLVRQRAERESARDSAAAAAAESVATGLESGDLSAAEVLDPAAAQVAYAELTAGLGGVLPQVDVVSVERAGAEASARLRLSWPFGNGWTYDTVTAVRADLADGSAGRWAAEFGPATVHPDLVEGDRLTASRDWPERAPVLGRDGAPLVTSAPVVEVGVQRSRVTDLDNLTGTLADLLGVDGAALGERLEAADPEAFVPVVTLRRPDYESLREQLQPLPGTVFRESTLPLAPTREFARALLGTVGPVTAEIVEAAGGRLAAGDVTGLSGLQRQYDQRMAGTPGATVSRVRGDDVTELLAVDPVPGEPVAVTIDARVQQAADAALAAAGGGNGAAALVAVDVPTGEVLAVANTPHSGANRALAGQYPPGSTFKTISTLALLRAGVDPAETVPCPATATVEGRQFRNFEGGAAGIVPFSTDFAESCNTAFVSLSQRLEPGALGAAAATVGLGLDWQVGVPAITGSVPEEDSPVELAAATIGQGEVLASPLAMAQAVSAIARGSWAAPTLVTSPVPEGEPPVAPPADPAHLATVAELMRQVAVDGTGSALADVPGEPVHAKTGTAEYGTDSPPRTHAWTVGFQGSVAFAVLVEDGESGGRVAVPVAEAFLRGLG